MPFPALGGVPLPDTHLLRTVARTTDSRKESMIAAAVVLACVINGDTMTGALRQATWLVVAIIILITVQLIASYLPQPRERFAATPTSSGRST
ncbi:MULTISPECIES: hypothetical protein [Streptomyces]|uniref:Uncharacterized protein n=1 Tax=Streptomyces griseosporeus TaxID=1910 RepID=A0ABV3KIW5_STRGS|nr:hypothetical protein [Streptomyces actuosus]MBM4820680.1 hypothetical protein [Streptomyces actuosus]